MKNIAKHNGIVQLIQSGIKNVKLTGIDKIVVSFKQTFTKNKSNSN